MKPILKTFVFFVLVFAFASIAEAQATRTWVSGVGDDVNPCSRTAPCKTFAGAISKTATNGEINCLDPAGYGAVTISKSITIDCEDTQGSILSAGTNGVIINITSVTDTKKAVKLRGLSINGVGTGINGVRVLSANFLAMDEVVIDGVTQHGVSIETTSGTPKITIDHCNFRSLTANGINTFITGGTVSLAVSNTVVSGSATGINLSSNTKATIHNSDIHANTTGIAAFQASVGVSGCNITNNTTGIFSNTGGQVRVMGSMITGNGTGLNAAGGTIVSFISNVFDGNTSNGSPTSSLPMQ
ncbi:MAG TPA: right-handed parallel beta-helix repeat-containing protein [Pyrinomonadaceae bacterium]|nr:right-handed parallel beta-helix repeat-containing protein [Pyrinomonadaceae bacterium]